MTATQIGLVQTSWRMVAANGARLTGSLLYQELTTILPELTNDIRQQQRQPSPRKVLAFVNYLIRNLHKPSGIINEVEDFSRRHLHYTLRDEQFIRVGRSLLDIISANLGDKWTAAIEQAWLNCYITVAEAIMNIAGTDQQEPIYYC